MHKTILKGGLKGGLVSLLLSTALTACGNANTDAPLKKAGNEAEAVAQYEKAKTALETAGTQLSAMRTCSDDNVLSEIASYDADMPDATLEQAQWFAANAKRDGVVTTQSGLQYKVNKASTMKVASPLPTQKVRVHYHGLFRDGKTFDSSYDRGEDISFPLNRVIAGWTQGVGLMKPCDAWTLYVPYELAYGPEGRPPTIPAKSPLIFHVQLLGIEG